MNANKGTLQPDNSRFRLRFQRERAYVKGQAQEYLNLCREAFRSKRMTAKVDVAEEVRKLGRYCVDLESEQSCHRHRAENVVGVEEAQVVHIRKKAEREPVRRRHQYPNLDADQRTSFVLACQD
jgi:hypothetical protein